MIVKRSYDRLVNLGNFENVKIGIILEQEFKPTNKEVPVKDQIKEFSKKLGKLAVQVVDEEVASIRDVKETVKKDTQEGA
jgi:hypothetical protein